MDGVSYRSPATGTAHLGWGAHIAVDIASGWGGGTIVSIVPTSFPQSQVITGPVTIRHRKSSSLASTQVDKHTSTQAQVLGHITPSIDCNSRICHFGNPFQLGRGGVYRGLRSKFYYKYGWSNWELGCVPWFFWVN